MKQTPSDIHDHERDEGQQDAAIELSGICLSLGGQKILDEVDLRVMEKDYLAIIGPNGGGKTTLLKVMLGLLHPDKGTVAMFGKPPKYTRHLVGYVPQDPLSDRDFPATAWDVTLMGRSARRGLFRRYTTDDRSKAEEALQWVEMDRLKDRQMGELSGGQRQRVLIARALAAEPRLLLFDEPTASLDTQIGRSIFELLGRLSREIAVVLVTHDLGVLSQHVKRVACMNHQLIFHEDGKTIDPKTMERIYGCPVDLIVHGDVAHRVLGSHSSGGSHVHG